MNNNTVGLVSDVELDEIEQLSRTSKPTTQAEPRLRRPDRNQLLLQLSCLEQLLRLDHEARMICAVVKKLDLAAFYKPLQAPGSDPGRVATDPALLVTLWLDATMNGM